SGSPRGRPWRSRRRPARAPAAGHAGSPRGRSCASAACRAAATPPRHLPSSARRDRRAGPASRERPSSCWSLAANIDPFPAAQNAKVAGAGCRPNRGAIVTRGLASAAAASSLGLVVLVHGLRRGGGSRFGAGGVGLGRGLLVADLGLECALAALDA